MNTELAGARNRALEAVGYAQRNFGRRAAVGAGSVRCGGGG